MICKHAFVSSLIVCASLAAAGAAESARVGLPNPFYAMDTALRRPGTELPEQLDLVKTLGYAGVAWTEQSTDQVQHSLAEIEQRGLKMFTIYCAAKITPEGQLTHSPHLIELMQALRGHGTLVWLHIGGKGPAIETLTGKEPLVSELRALAETAAANGLKVAVYPHFGEWTARFGDATRLAKLVNHPAFGVTFNLCHCLAVGDEARIGELLEQARPVLFTVTINGADSGVTSAQWKQLIQTLDKGTFDVRIVLKKLKQIGFTGPIGFQGYAIPGDARSILTPTMEAWRKL
jgi:sugar phosphate isomerase/epimerase